MPSLLSSLFAADVEVTVPSGTLRGTGEVRGLLGAFLTAVPDNRLTVSCTVQQGETIVIEATYSGTHTRPARRTRRLPAAERPHVRVSLRRHSHRLRGQDRQAPHLLGQH